MTALKYNKFLDHPNPKPPKMRFGLSAKSFADISDLFRMSPKRLADKTAFIDVSSNRLADKSTIVVISSDRSADNSTVFGMFKKMFADKSIAFGVSKKNFADKSVAFQVFKKMFADNSDAFGMSLNRILLLQTFRSKFLFWAFALGAASTKQKTMAQSDGRLEDVKMNSRGLLSPRSLTSAQ